VQILFFLPMDERLRASERQSRASQRANIAFWCSLLVWTGLGIGAIVSASFGGPVLLSVGLLIGYVGCSFAMLCRGNP
jgi:hypothetical protein